LKGYVYYQLPTWKHQTTTVGLFQVAYQGSPVSSYIDVGGMFANQVSEAVYTAGRGKWVNTTTDANGNITIGNPYTRRTPWYTQSDFNVDHSIKVGEHQALGFALNITNVFNQHAITAYYGGLNSTNFTTPLIPGQVTTGGVTQNIGFSSGADFYRILEGGYNVQSFINGIPANGNIPAIPRVIQSSWYGQPFLHQLARGLRFSVHYTF